MFFETRDLPSRRGLGWGGRGPGDGADCVPGSQAGGRLDEVLQEVAALRALVAEQGQRIARLEEQLSRLENGHV